MSENNEPKLAPPGAGLPKMELFVGRLLFAIRRRRGSRESFNADFVREREGIQKLYQSCGAKMAAQRILIKRVPGLEDSSRNWSVWMTLDHLRIVNHSIAGIIGKLTQGIVPKGTASTAAVKPSANVNLSVVAEYEASCDAVLLAVAAAQELKTAARYAHPWFGPLDAFSWHAMASGHMAIHRGQIERILHGIRTQQNRPA